jgi:hypothetical protein
MYVLKSIHVGLAWITWITYLILATEAELHEGSMAQRHRQWNVEKSIAPCRTSWYEILAWYGF